MYSCANLLQSLENGSLDNTCLLYMGNIMRLIHKIGLYK